MSKWKYLVLLGWLHHPPESLVCPHHITTTLCQHNRRGWQCEIRQPDHPTQWWCDPNVSIPSHLAVGLESAHGVNCPWCDWKVSMVWLESVHGVKCQWCAWKVSMVWLESVHGVKCPWCDWKVSMVWLESVHGVNGMSMVRLRCVLGVQKHCVGIKSCDKIRRKRINERS